MLMLLSLSFNSLRAQIIEPSLTYGVTSYSYYAEGNYSTSYPNPFFNSFVTAPTIGLRLDVPKYNFGIETNYYQASVPTTVDFQYQSYAKTFFDLGVYASYKNSKFHMFYANENFRNQASFGLGNVNRLAFDQGIGLAYSYTHASYDISIRSENTFRIVNGIVAVDNPLTGLTLKLSKSLALTESKTEKSKGPLANLINLQVGLNLTGNELNGEVPSMLPIKIAPLVGLELTFKDYHIYMRRVFWYNLDVSNYYGGKLTSMYNQIGFGYKVDVNNKKHFFVGLHHFWNNTRGQQYLDFRENGFSDDVLWFIPQNRGVGLELKYPFANNIDFILDADYYYEAHPRLGTGFNRESFRLSAVYNFR